MSLRDRALAAALAEPLVRDVHDIAIYKHDGRESVSLHLKMKPDVPLAEAHEVAERVEAVLRAQPEVDDVHTHLEPLERPLIAEDASGASDEKERERITELVVERTSHEPRELRLLHTDGGLVVFVSVVAGPESRAAGRTRARKPARGRYPGSAATYGRRRRAYRTMIASTERLGAS